MLFQFAEAIQYCDYLGQLPAELDFKYLIRASLHIWFNSALQFKSLMQASTWKNFSFNQPHLVHIQRSITLLERHTGNKANNKGLLCLLKRGKWSSNGLWMAWLIYYKAEIISKRESSGKESLCLKNATWPANSKGSIYILSRSEDETGWYRGKKQRTNKKNKICLGVLLL